AITTVVQALSVFGSSREAAIRTLRRRSSPRTTGQYGSGESSASRRRRRPAHPPRQAGKDVQCSQLSGIERAASNSAPHAPAQSEIQKSGLGDRGPGWEQRSPIGDAEPRRYPTNAGIPRGFPSPPADNGGDRTGWLDGQVEVGRSASREDPN